MRQKTKHLLWVTLGRPVMGMGLCVGLAIGWFSFLAPFLFLDFLPQFSYYETVFVSNPGTSDNAVYFWWAWIPTLFLIIFGIFWSSGLLGQIWKVVSGD